MLKSSSDSPATSAPVIADGAPEATTDSSRLVARKIDRAGWWSFVPVALFCSVGLALRPPEPNAQTLADSTAIAALHARSRTAADAMFAAQIKQGATPVSIAGVLAADETMIATLHPAGGYSTLRGELAPAIQVRGEAPIGGRVTQVLVKTGQKVKVGDPIMRVEGKVNAPGSKVAQKKQDAAENAQVAASQQQDALQEKLQTRQARLEKAQHRVDAAQKRVAMAREVVQRLGRGETVTRADVAALSTPQLSVRLASRGASTGTSRESIAMEAERREAERAARQSRREAKQAMDAAEQARSDAEAAAKLAQAKKQVLKDAQAFLAKADAGLAAGTGKSADVEVARSAATAAQTAVQDSTAKADAAQKLADARDADAEKLRTAANFSDKKLARLPEAEATSAPAATPSAAPLDADEAAQLAQGALEESAAASAEAERLKSEIDSYARQVKSLHAKLTDVSQNLETAQMEVVESKIAEKLEAVRSPASGVVLNVAASASEVTPGETIIAIGRPDQLEIRFEDTSNAWKTLKPGTMLPAVVQTATGDAIPVMAELREITAPAKVGEAAILMTTIANPATEHGRRFQSGLKVTCSISRPGTREALSVPSTALLRDEAGQNLVAVLSPLQGVQASPAVEAANGAAETTPQTPEMLYRVEWRTVTMGQSDGLASEIAGGLQPGERIALRPEPLRQLTQTHGPNAVVKLNA